MNKVIFETIMKISITGSIFFLEAYFLSIFTQKKFSAKWHFVVSKICMILFLLPINLIVGDAVLSKSEFISTHSSDIVKQAYNSFQLANLEYLFVAIWLIGAIIYLTTNIVSYFRFKWALVSFDSYDKKLNDILRKQNINNNKIQIRRNSSIRTPMLIGIINPIIRIPNYLNDYEELSLIINHELIHYKRKDLFFKFLSIIVTSINWFNPLVYIANKRMNRWCEISCDELLVNDKELSQRKLYGNLLLKVIENIDIKKENNKAVSAYLCNEGKYVKNRLYIILKFKKANIIKKILSSVVLTMILFQAIATTTFATTEARNKIRSLMEDKFVNTTFEINGIDAPENINIDNNTENSVYFVVDPSKGEIIK